MTQITLQVGGRPAPYVAEMRFFMHMIKMCRKSQHNQTIGTSMSVFKDQEVFMKACGQTTDVYNAEQATMYCDLIAEEYSEFEDSGSAITDLDAIIDCIVVLIGYGLSCGYDVAGAWDEVIRSNMAKIDPETGTVIRREDGKILKPEDWTPPDLSRFVP